MGEGGALALLNAAHLSFCLCSHHSITLLIKVIVSIFQPGPDQIRGCPSSH